jgi:hypothetical protein
MPNMSAYLRPRVNCFCHGRNPNTRRKPHSEAHWLDTTMPMLSTDPRTPIPRINESEPGAGDFNNRNQSARVTGPPK